MLGTILQTDGFTDISVPGQCVFRQGLGEGLLFRQGRGGGVYRGPGAGGFSAH